jgi:hypothetical protein
MKRFKVRHTLFMLILGVLLITGCGGSDEAALITAGHDDVLPGACTATGPKVTSSNPTDGDIGVSRRKVITVTFSEAMDPDTIVVTDSTTPEVLTFTLRDNDHPLVNIKGTVAMNTANTIATFTPDEDLSGESWYTATITKYAKSASPNFIELGCSYQWEFQTGTSIAAGQAPVFLGTAGTYGIFASADADITLTGPSVLVDGDVGLMNGLGDCINCSVTTVTGAINNGNSAAEQAQIDINAAYVDASTRATNQCTLGAPTDIAAPQGACTGYTVNPGSVDLGTTYNTYLPGLYWSGTAIDLGVGKIIALDAQGDASAVFIFQSDSYITTGHTSEVKLLNGAQAKNVFWVAYSAVTLGYSSIFKGTAIASTAAITVNYGTSGLPTLVAGRMLSHGAAITVDTFATITVPTP